MHRGVGVVAVLGGEVAVSVSVIAARAVGVGGVADIGGVVGVSGVTSACLIRVRRVVTVGRGARGRAREGEEEERGVPE